jgi:uncharacterized protein (DUF1800 family)
MEVWKTSLGAGALLLAGALCSLAGSCGPAGSAASGSRAANARLVPPVTWDAMAARHVLDRFAFGPRPGEVEALVELGLERWLSAQLDATPLRDAALEAALEPYADALRPPAELIDDWNEMGGGAMIAMSDMTGAEEASMDRGVARPRDMRAKGELQRIMKPYFREHLADLVAAQLTRQLSSPRQLEEAMIDFWANHFNVFAPKGLVRSFAGDYVERVLRRHALGRFEDLLLATARHPAMLIYLDNAASTFKRGLNENYARELLELHTLGAGAFSENDVVGVARILTGWSVSRPGQPRPFEFAFRFRQHDYGPKTVLDDTYPAGQGEEEGLLLIHRLATHTATAAHLARKLCTKFVADEPPESCVDVAREAFTDSGGEMRAVLVAIAHDPSFWQSRRAKLKRPLELAVSALRALDARLDGTSRVAQSLKALGEPMLEESVPTGYPEDAAAWASSGGFLSRMSFASRLGFERLKGVVVEVERVFGESEPEALVARGNRSLLGGAGTEQTLGAIQSALEAQQDVRDRRRLAAALFLGSPEFQRQ